MNIILRKADDKDIQRLRNDYLDNLAEPQELFLEMVIWDSAKYMVFLDTELAGYFILGKENILAEFYINPEYLSFSEDIFKTIIENHAITKAYAKSFDLLMVESCMHMKKLSRIIGYLFRDMEPDWQFIEDEKITVHLAKHADKKTIVPVKEGLFDHDDEVKYVILNKNMFMYSFEDRFIGCGIFQQTIKGRNNYDIGMLVHPDHREKGFGTYVIRHLTQHCHNNNWRPTCGCAVENTGSRKTLEKAGFITKHSMQEFEF